MNFVLQPMPQQARRGESCSGCGFCCQQGPCFAAELAFEMGKDESCPGLVWENGRYWCILVLTEDSAPIENLISKGLGIGMGCYFGATDEEAISKAARKTLEGEGR